MLSIEERDLLTDLANQGSVEAQHELGELSAKGDPVNWVDAYYWYSLAARNGFTAAADKADKAGKILSEARRGEVDKLVENWRPAPPPFSAEALSRLTMKPAGYMFKRIKSIPDWLNADSVGDIYSVSDCVSDDFADYINFWKHNGYWLFNSPKVMEELATEQSIDLTSLKLFYYEVFEAQYDEAEKKWMPFSPEASFVTNVHVPKTMKLEGFDVVTFLSQSSPEHSPLSCNGLAKEIPVNGHCLLPSFDEAKNLLEAGRFDASEPGPFRIFAVYSVER